MKRDVRSTGERLADAQRAACVERARDLTDRVQAELAWVRNDALEAGDYDLHRAAHEGLLHLEDVRQAIEQLRRLGVRT